MDEMKLESPSQEAVEAADHMASIGLTTGKYRERDAEIIIQSAIDKSRADLVAVLKQVAEEHAQFGWGFDEVHDAVLNALKYAGIELECVIEEAPNTFESRAAPASAELRRGEQPQEWKPVSELNRSKMQFVLTYQDGEMRTLLWNPSGFWEHPNPIGERVVIEPTHYMELPSFAHNAGLK